MKLSFDRKSVQILKILVDSGTGVTVDELSDLTNFSKRTVYYLLKNINIELRTYGLNELQSIRGFGIVIPTDIRAQVSFCISEKEKEGSEYFSLEERTSLIITTLYMKGKMTLEGLASICKESKRNMQNDIPLIDERIKKFGVRIIADQKGIILDGSESQKRFLVLYVINTILRMIDDGEIESRFVPENKALYDRLNSFCEEYDLTFKDDLTRRLAILLSIVKNRRTEFQSNFNEIEKSWLYQHVQDSFPELEENDQKYLTLVLMTHRLQDIKEHSAFADQESDKLSEAVTKIIEHFETKAGIRFEDKAGLFDSVFQHMYYSMRCWRLGVIDINPLRDQIETEYAGIFTVVDAVVADDKCSIPYFVTEDEEAYLTLLLGSQIERAKKEKINVLVVCQSGIATGQMLKSELESINNLIRIVKVSSRQSYKKYEEEADLIVSTVPLKTAKDVVFVHPILTTYDKNKFQRCIGKYIGRGTSKRNLDDIMAVLQPYLKDGMQEEARNAIKPYLSEKTDFIERASKQSARLIDLLGAENINFVDNFSDWKGLIYECGKSLISEGKIESSYLTACIENIVQNGAYSYFQNKMYLLHASPNSGVNRLSVSISILREEQIFPSDIPVKYLVILAPQDYSSHIDALGDIVKLFSNKDFVSYLSNATDNKEIYKKIAETLQGE
jgi:mannitol operon transcriptional antiterminator